MGGARKYHEQKSDDWGSDDVALFLTPIKNGT